MEDLATFYSNFMEQVHEDAAFNDVPVEMALTENILEYVKESNEANSPEVVLIENDKTSPKGFGKYKINAFDYSDLSGELDLFVTLYKETDSVSTATRGNIEDTLNKLIHFFNLATSGQLSKHYKKDNPEIVEITDMLRDEFSGKRIELLRFFILTNARMREEWTLDDAETTDQNIATEFHVWDIETIQKAEQSARQMSEIDITLDNPIECIKINDGNDKVSTYLGIIPAIELAKIYSRYKDKLIDKNVRNYLGGKIKVNARIAKTLREDPQMFFSYNNGISSTASEVVLSSSLSQDDDNARLFIVSLRNWSIVNGGQTTCTIYNMYKKNVDITKAFVTMKVSEVKDKESSDMIVQNIAESANSQTQIRDSDLNANSKYLIAIDKISKKLWTPSQSARPGTLWYFERLRGQYLSDKLNAGTPGSVKVAKFTKECPKSQILTKTDIAKLLMAWDGFPHEASKGNEVCFNNFWKRDYKNQEVTPEYFHEIVAKKILYDTIQETFKEAGHKGYANIVGNYVLATLALKTQNNIDLEYIWQSQSVQPELRNAIKECVEITVSYINQRAKEGINPTVIAKRLDFWNAIKIQMANVKIQAGSYVQKKPSEELTKEQLATIEKVKTYGIDNWGKLSQWGRNTHKMSIMEKKRIDHLIVALTKNPDSISFQTAESCLKILRMSEDSGFNEE